jgi:hypothetical protein
MNKAELKATKPGLKNSAGKKKASGRGGARPGSGRKKKFEDIVPLNLDCPFTLLEGMAIAAIENKTNYILQLIAKDLKARNLGKEITKKIETVESILEQ